MSLDALSELVDMLPEDKPKPESPKLKPKDIVPVGAQKQNKPLSHLPSEKKVFILFLLFSSSFFHRKAK